MNQSQKDTLFSKFLAFVSPASTPYWGLLFFIFASNFSFYLLRIHDYLIFTIFFLTLILVVKMKLYKKGYYYLTSLFIVCILYFAPSLYILNVGWVAEIDYIAWLKHFLLTAVLSFFFVKLYLLPRLKEECNKMLFILPFEYLFLLSFAYILVLCLLIVYLYFNPHEDITALVFIKAIFRIPQ